ncbi:hypothetical protein B4U79_00551 [Dinothrombium tinctorium]|uniref:Uncharacterized protein n=1 Tax=Dinothrombium tinctorium TaxID=1965070 RepID=A0A3S3PJC1_9ACAR|nr:hypothetical protein B4U79_00551 [Dinothrombium tinctorium]
METEKLTSLNLNEMFRNENNGHHRFHHNRRGTGVADSKTLLSYAKCFLLCAYFVFICGSGITLNELFQFLIEDIQDSEWMTGIILLVLGLVSFLGLWGAFKEDSCLLMVYGIITLVVFFLHVILLFLLKNVCADMKSKCHNNMGTPPGIAPILVAVSELSIAMCAFFMALIIESEKRKQPIQNRHRSNRSVPV